MMKKFLTLFVLIFAAAGGAFAQTARTDNAAGPLEMLSAYYDAVNRKDYRRAYGYWQSPAESFENFTRGFAETKNVRLIVEPPGRIEGAAGSLYAEVPAVLIAEQTSGGRKIFAGCYTLRKPNLSPEEAGGESGWRIYRADMREAGEGAEIPQMLKEACPAAENSPADRQQARVPGVIAFDEAKSSDGVEVPTAVKADEEFQIAVITTGSGCVNAGETEVVLSDTSADVFVYDLTTATRPGVACTMIFKQFRHTARLKFSKPGEAVVRVWGRRITGGDDAPAGRPIIVEKRITVR
jgi:hypothetical protein